MSTSAHNTNWMATAMRRPPDGIRSRVAWPPPGRSHATDQPKAERGSTVVSLICRRQPLLIGSDRWTVPADTVSTATRSAGTSMNSADPCPSGVATRTAALASLLAATAVASSIERTGNHEVFS